MVHDPTHIAYVGAFSLAAVGCFVGAARATGRLAGDVRDGLVSLFVVSGLWASVTVLQLLAPTATLKTSLFTIGLVVGFATVFCWVYFASAYTGSGLHRNRAVRLAALGSFVLIAGLKLTNGYHGGYFDASLVQQPFPHLALTRYPLHWAVTAVAYLIASVGFVLLVRMYLDSGHDTGRITLLAGLLAVPIVPDFVSVIRPDLLLGVTYEPLGVAVFAVASLFVVETDFDSVATPGRHQVVEELRDPIVVVDSTGRVRDANAAAFALFDGCEESLVVGEQSPPLLCRATTDRDDAMTTALTVGEGTREFLVRSSQVSLGPHTLGRAVVFTDVTELERQRRTLCRQRQEMDHIADALTHELRNDLNIASGYATLLAERGSGSDGTESLGTLTAAHDRMEAVVSDLSALATLGQEASSVEPQPFAKTVRRAFEWADTDGLSLTVASDGTLEAERGRLVSLFANLFEHAAERDATTVSAELTADGFRVRHDGDPIPDERHGDVFEYGTASLPGIGLPNAAAFARVHGWSLSLSNRPDGTTEIRADGIDTASTLDDTGDGGDDTEDEEERERPVVEKERVRQSSRQDRNGAVGALD